MTREEEISAAAREVTYRLAQKKMTLSAAESCTGGWFAKSVVDIPGASAVFFGGVVSYVNKVKEDVLGVPGEMLSRYTAVSAPVAAAMARGVRRVTGSDLGISVTGLAGPDGGSEEIPVGRVYVGLSDGGDDSALCLDLSGGRDAVREEAVLRMLQLLLKKLT